MFSIKSVYSIGERTRSFEAQTEYNSTQFNVVTKFDLLVKRCRIHKFKKDFLLYCIVFFVIVLVLFVLKCRIIII